MRCILYLFVFFCSLSLFGQSSVSTDSLEKKVYLLTSDTARYRLFAKLSVEFSDSDPNKGIYYGLKADSIARLLSDSNKIAYARLALADNYIEQGNYELATKNGFEALRIFERKQNKHGLASAYKKLGITYFYNGSYDRAIENWNTSLPLFNELKDSAKISNVYLNLGAAYFSLGDDNLAVENYRLALSYLRKDNEILQADIFTNMGNVYTQTYEEGEENSNLLKALSYYRQAATLYMNNMDSLHYAMVVLNLGYTNLMLKNLTRSENQVMEAVGILLSLGKKDHLSTAYSVLSDVYFAKKEYRLAHDFRDSSYALLLELRSESSDKAMIEMDKKYQTEKKEKENELLRIDNELHKATAHERQLLNYGMGFSIFLLLIVSLLIFMQFKTKQKANRLLDLQNKTIMSRNKEISYQRDRIEFQNNELLASIKYAKRIQEAILPVDETLNENFSEHFILYKPKDIVSGDFYWIENVGSKVFWAVADCTGHGVPGAFLSILGSTGLKKIITELHIHKPSEILTRLTAHVINSLKESKDGFDVNDGMDIALCCWDKKSNLLEFSGAYNPMYLIRDKELIILKATRRPIGSYSGKVDAQFKNHTMEIKPNDQIYVFSDGFTDQFGYSSDNKYSSERFREFILQHHTLAMPQQCDQLNDEFYKWKGDEEQIDDICIFGVKI